MKNRVKLLLELVAVVISGVILLPLVIVLLNSFKNQKEAAEMSFKLPTQWAIWDNYAYVYKEGGIGSAFLSTAIVTICSVFVTILLASMAAYIIERRSSRFTKRIQTLLIVGMILPDSLIATYFLMINLNLVRTYHGVVLLYVSGLFAIITFLHISFFRTVPRELDEAAIIDGIGPYSLFYKIIFPLLLPITATAVIVVFMSVWNDFSTAFYFLNTAKRHTLSVTIYYFFGTNSANWNYVFTDIVMISAPVLILYLFLQRYIIAGLTQGSVKG